MLGVVIKRALVCLVLGAVGLCLVPGLGLVEGSLIAFHALDNLPLLPALTEALSYGCNPVACAGVGSGAELGAGGMHGLSDLFEGSALHLVLGLGASHITGLLGLGSLVMLVVMLGAMPDTRGIACWFAGGALVLVLVVLTVLLVPVGVVLVLADLLAPSGMHSGQDALRLLDMELRAEAAGRAAGLGAHGRGQGRGGARVGTAGQGRAGHRGAGAGAGGAAVGQGRDLPGPASRASCSRSSCACGLGVHQDRVLPGQARPLAAAGPVRAAPGPATLNGARLAGLADGGGLRGLVARFGASLGLAVRGSVLPGQMLAWDHAVLRICC